MPFSPKWWWHPTLLWIATTMNLTTTTTTHAATVLVTGGAGFVGSHVAQALLHRGDKVVVIDEVNDYYDVNLKEQNLKILQSIIIHPNNHSGSGSGNNKILNDTSSNASSSKDQPNIFLYRGDICNATLVRHIFEQHKPTHICHMAARAGVRPSIQDPFVYIHSNIRGTTQLLELAREYQVQNFVFASSSSVYGGSQSTLFDEAELVDRPISPYAASKKACELFAYTYHHLYSLNVSALRFFTVYGPRGRPDMAPFMFIDRISRQQSIQQFGDGSSSRDYTFIDDIVQGVLKALDQPRKYEIYNLGKGSGTKLTEFVQMVERYTNQTARLDILPDQPGDVPYTCANVSKAQTLLGYQPSMSFEQGIQKTVEWYQKEYVPPSPSSKLRRRLKKDLSEHKQEHIWDNVTLVQPHTGHKTVLVTGAAGFIGSHVAEYLLKRGDNVVVVDEINDYYDITIKESNLKLLLDTYGASRVKIYRGDIGNDTLVTHIFEQERPKWICHLAARAGVRPSIQNPFVYIHSNIQGTTRLLEASRIYGVENFVVASSSSVYGGSKSTLFSEDEPVDNPISPYAASKKATELFAYTWHHLYRLNVTALRFFTVYGPRGRPDMAPFMFVDQISRGIEIKQFGDGSSSRDYTYVDDIVNGVVRAIDRPYPYQIFNLGKGSGTKLSEFISIVEKYTGRKANIKLYRDQPGDVPYTCADVSKAKRLLGYLPSVPFEEGIRRTVEWYQSVYGESSQYQNQPSTDQPATLSLPNPLPASLVDGNVNPFDELVDDISYFHLKNTIPNLPPWIAQLATIQWFFLILFICFRYLKASLRDTTERSPRDNAASPDVSGKLLGKRKMTDDDDPSISTV